MNRQSRLDSEFSWGKGATNLAYVEVAAVVVDLRVVGEKGGLIGLSLFPNGLAKVARFYDVDGGTVLVLEAETKFFAGGKVAAVIINLRIDCS
jgi:hypothetical protein